MKLNNEYNFGVVPTVGTPRSRFLMHKNIRTTFNAAKLIPFYVNSLIQPGDHIRAKGTVVIRMSTPRTPTMDNLFADIRAFFVPHRLVWPNWKRMIGENETGAWTQQIDYEVPQIKIYVATAAESQKIAKGDALQYMGIPIGYPKAVNVKPSLANCTSSISCLPWRSLAKVWNDWYRDENFCPPLYLYTGDSDQYGVRGSTNVYWGKYEDSGGLNIQVPMECPPVYKFKDMFNACLPEPQKGAPITLPIGSEAPVRGDGKTLGLTGRTSTTAGSPYVSGGLVGVVSGNAPIVEANQTVYDQPLGTLPTGSNYMYQSLGVTTDYTKSGLVADLSNAVAATINAQRMAFAAQRILELQARAGTRYNEVISSVFQVKGLQSAVVQRSEYLGGYRLPMMMNQVVQTSSTDAVSPQGNTAAYSLTIDSQQLFDKGFEEWGTLIFCLCVRQEHSYSQGIEMQWQKKKKLDFYWPQLAFLGEQDIKNKTIYADGSSNDEDVFGFNERWVEYRTEMNLNTGAFSPDYAQTLAFWHYGDKYNSLPVLSDTWRRETEAYIDRTLAVASNVEDQFLMDSRWEFDKTSAIPLRSIPGLLDHF